MIIKNIRSKWLVYNYQVIIQPLLFIFCLIISFSCYEKKLYDLKLKDCQNKDSVLNEVKDNMIMELGEQKFRNYEIKMYEYQVRFSVNFLDTSKQSYYGGGISVIIINKETCEIKKYYSN